jgi:uncharacterized membrane protein (DUF373 family)
MMKVVDNVVRIVVLAMMGLLSVVVVAGTLDLALLLWSELASPPIGVLDVKEILELLGFFLMVLIAIEMIYVVRLFVEHRHLDVQAVLLVSLIAVARKVIVLDLEKYEAMHMLGIAALLLALAGALFLLRRCHAPVAPAP